MQNESKHCGSCGWIGSTIGRKQVIGLTGLGLSGFLFTHMLGNMLIIVGPQAYNQYAHALTSNPLIYAAEVGLVFMFLVHLLLAVRLSLAGLRARDSRYAVLSSGAKATSWIQRTLWPQGLLILAFAVSHLVTMKYGAHYTVNYGQGEIRDLHKLVVEVFMEPGFVIGYLVALVILGLHVSHGVSSAVQTLGVHHPRFQKGIRCTSILYAIVVIGGFISQPLYVFFIHRG